MPIVAFLFGLILGNFATSLLYRLPRDLPLNGSANNGKPPHCSECGHHLRFYEYLPLLNWLFTRGTCNYCSQKIDLSYSALELSTAIFATVLYLVIGLNEIYPLILLFGSLLILQNFLYFRSDRTFDTIHITIATLAIIYRVMVDLSYIEALLYFLTIFIILHSVKERLNQNLYYTLLISTIWLPIEFAITLTTLSLLLNHFTSKEKRMSSYLLLFPYCLYY